MNLMKSSNFLPTFLHYHDFGYDLYRREIRKKNGSKEQRYHSDKLRALGARMTQVPVLVHTDSTTAFAGLQDWNATESGHSSFAPDHIIGCKLGCFH